MSPFRRLRLSLPSLGSPRRLVEHPASAGTWTLLLLASVLVLTQLVLGRFPLGPEGDASDFFVALLHCLGIGYLTGAYLAVLRSSRRSWELLAGLLPPGSRPAERLLPPLGPPTRGWTAALLGGLLLGFVGPYLSEPDIQGVLGWWRPGSWSPEVFWHRILGLALGAEVGLFAHAVVALSRGLGPAVRALPFPDLLDPSPFAPVVAHGMTNGLLVAGLLSVMALFALDLGFTPILVLFAVLTAVLIAVSTFLPLGGIRRRIRKRKAEERAWCDEGIRAARDALRRGGTPTAGGEAARGGVAPTPGGETWRSVEPREARPGLADLVAYRRLVEEVPEWPLDTPAIRRIALYLAIPMGSWVASALVQHVVERWIGGG